MISKRLRAQAMHLGVTNVDKQQHTYSPIVSCSATCECTWAKEKERRTRYNKQHGWHSTCTTRVSVGLVGSGWPERRSFAVVASDGGMVLRSRRED
jgi:hypothetical protein